MKKNITSQIIVKEAIQLISESGINAFSLHKLSDRLNIKTASLYSHISGKDEIIAKSGILILKDYKSCLDKASENKTRSDALLAIGRAKRKYAKDKPNLYELIMNMQIMDSEELKNKSKIIIEPIEKALDGYNISPAQKVNFERAFRALTHDFISHEQKGYFSHFSQDIDESYEFSMKLIIDEIEGAENEN